MNRKQIRMLVMAAALAGSAAPVLAFAQSALMPHDHTPDPARGADTLKRSPSPRGAYVYIGWPNDGEVVHSTRVKVWFGTRNFGVAPAGVYNSNTGHHHLLIDTALPPMDEPIPNDRNHMHFGLGQTETVIELSPGVHTLQLLMADGNHVPHDPPLISKKITIRVAGDAPTTPVKE